MHSTVRYDCLFAFRRLISGVLLVRRVGQPLNENQSRRHKPLSQVCHGFVAVQSLVAKIESALWSQLSPKISAQFDRQFFVDCRQWFQKFFGIASSRSVIGSGNSCHPLNQSDNKPRTKRAWPLVFSRASGSLPVLTLKSDWLFVTFPFILIALFSLWYHSIVLLFFQVLSIECPKTETKVITTNQNKCYHHYCPVRTETLKRGKTRVIKVGSVFVLHLTGWNDGASFLVQSKSKVNKTDATQDHFRL